MKITCTLQEWSQLIRQCEKANGGCFNCALHDVCGEVYIENAIEVEIIAGEAKADGADGN